MQEFIIFIYTHFKESPLDVLKKALSLDYSYMDLFYILYYQQKATVDPFLDEKLFMAEISTVCLDSLFSELIKIEELLQTRDNQALLQELLHH